MLDIVLTDNIESIGAELWNELCGTDYPFLRYEFLHALEQSGSVGKGTGWLPLHLSLKEGDTTVAVMPLYLKQHSYGEYVFDWAWADAYSRYGLEYYPKLLSAIPFTPAYGPRIGTKRPLEQVIPVIREGIPQIAAKMNASSWHGLFAPQDTIDLFRSETLMPRLGSQYHWFNHEYRDFDHFLEHFSSRKRKNLRKERKKVTDQGVELRTFAGKEITDTLLHRFYHFYQITYLKRGRKGYLTPEFFTRLRDTMPEHLVLVVAFVDEQAVAGALSLRSSTTLYGRYWGCLEEYDSLHFETCYYQGIEYCIRERLERFDPGAQGEHKIQRGFEPIETWSVHWIQEPGFREPIARFLEEEEAMMREQIAELTTWLPFKKSP
ncbi:GNAT family N-acetyltransferase [Pontibacterium granulatum]|uniref:GNAT family N-acetyltransferase n=1 Tax=Pontibacterium granulatum TaxID=2036029 RepID=UPI00249A686C|nr:GNAT family N-acetyltransferase [Pontibacterium granulatum]MDI3326052.1 GNAT family N-acetyltransferase [Pontibacterium granulatum]